MTDRDTDERGGPGDGSQSEPSKDGSASDAPEPDPPTAPESPSDLAGADATEPTGEEGDDGGPVTGVAEEGPRRTPDRRILVKWTGTVLLAAVLLLVVGLVAVEVVDPAELWMVVAVVVPLTLLGLVWVALRYHVWAFQIRPDHLFLQRGVYRHVETVVPYVRIQHVDTQRGPVERALRLSTLVIYTAGSRGADVAIPGLPAAEAETMQNRVKELAIAAEGGDAL